MLGKPAKKNWILVNSFMKAWEHRTIKGQRGVSLKPFNVRFLETLPTEQVEETLRKLVNAEMSYEDINMYV